MSLLDFDFMRRALLAAVAVGMVAPAIGVFWCSGGWLCSATAWVRRSRTGKAGIRPAAPRAHLRCRGGRRRDRIEVLRIRSRMPET